MRNALFVTMALSLAVATALSTPAAHADPKPTPGVKCSSGGLSSPPSFNQVSPGRAEYHFSGACITREGQSLAYRIDGTWTPGETGGKTNASEVYRVDRVSGPSESFTALVGWHCDADPWLFDTRCDRVGDNIPSEPYAFWEEFGRGPQPSSRRALSADQRVALRAEYERANGTGRSGFVRDRASAGAAVVHVTPAAPGTMQEPARTNTVDAVSLNPQPLPPEPDPDPKAAAQKAATPVQDSGETRAIIIVGGKTRAPATKAKAYKKIDGG